MSEEQSEYSGGSVSYYQVTIEHPTTEGRKPYTAECNDIIEALEMTFAEANVFKAVWRSAASRRGKRKSGYDNGKYDAEKVVFYGNRMIVKAERDQASPLQLPSISRAQREAFVGDSIVDAEGRRWPK